MNSWNEVKTYIENLLKPGITNSTNVQKLLNSFQAVINMLNTGSIDPENDAEWKDDVTYARDVQPVLWRDSWLVSNIANNLGIPPISAAGVLHPAWRIVVSSIGAGINIWRPIIYPNILEIVFHEGGLYYLDRQVVGNGPFVSVSFSAELAQEKWVFITGSATINLPVGLSGQIYKLNRDNTNEVDAVDFMKVGNYITTTAQLEDSSGAQGVFISFANVFQNWRRFSHGGNPASPGLVVTNPLVPTIPSQTQSWSLVGNEVRSTINSGSFIGFVSDVKLLNYDHRATLTSTTSDNDIISLIIAYVEDKSDMVLNNAFGLNPATHLGINVTDEFIPNQHTLSLLRARLGLGFSYIIYYNYGRPDEAVIFNGSSLPLNTSSNWNSNEVDVRVLREGDLIKCYTTDFSDFPLGKGTLRFELAIDLRDDIRTIKFRGPASYGYGARSQANATFKNVTITGSRINEIYDLRNGNIWIANGAGTWNLSTVRVLADELPYGTLVYNPRFYEVTFFVKPYDFYVISTMSDNFSEQTFATIAARNAHNVTFLPFNAFVTDDGDGNWALYKAISLGVAATYVKLSDFDLINAVMTASAIASAYEGFSDVRRFTSALLTKLNGIATAAEVNDDAEAIKTKIESLTGAQRLSMDFLKDNEQPITPSQFELVPVTNELRIRTDQVPVSGSQRFVSSGDMFGYELANPRAVPGSSAVFGASTFPSDIRFAIIRGFQNMIFIACTEGATQRVIISSDGGLSFSFAGISNNGNYQSMDISPSGTICVGDRNISGNTIRRSTNFGRTWVSSTVPSQRQVSSIAYGDGVWVASCVAGTLNRVMHSIDDGVTWINGVTHEDNTFENVCFHKSKFYICSFNGTNRLAVSINRGLNFTAQSIGNFLGDFSRLASFKNALCILDSSLSFNPRIRYTVDEGVNWLSSLTVSPNTQTTLCMKQIGAYLFVGGGVGFLVRSKNLILWEPVVSGTILDINDIEATTVEGLPVIILINNGIAGTRILTSFPPL